MTSVPACLAPVDPEARPAPAAAAAFRGPGRAEAVTVRCLTHVLQALPVPVLVLNWNLRPVFANREARQACAEWRRGILAARQLKISRVPDIPSEVTAACVQEKKRRAWREEPEAGSRRTAPAFARAAHPSRDDLSARIELFVAPHGAAAPCFIVRFLRRTEPSPRPAAGRLEVLCCLTPCEREIALAVAQGLANAAIARHLGKSIPTVKMQLRSVYRKLQVGNRVQLAAMLA